jgi:hypothetical protein
VWVYLLEVDKTLSNWPEKKTRQTSKVSTPERNCIGGPE